MSRALRTRRARIWSHVRVLPSPSLPALPLPVRFWLGMLARPVAVLALGGVAATLAPSLLPQADSLMLSAVRFILALIGGLK